MASQLQDSRDQRVVCEWSRVLSRRSRYCREQVFTNGTQCPEMETQRPETGTRAPETGTQRSEAGTQRPETATAGAGNRDTPGTAPAVAADAVPARGWSAPGPPGKWPSATRVQAERNATGTPGQRHAIPARPHHPVFLAHWQIAKSAAGYRIHSEGLSSAPIFRKQLPDRRLR